jgi:hypothetical protein
MFGWGFGSAPKWYREWRHEAVHTLIDKNAALNLNQWPRWDYELDKGQLTFSDDERLRIICDVQIVGTTSRDWLWSWANSHWHEGLTEDARKTRAFGAENRVRELTAGALKEKSLNDLGWALSAVTARVCGSLGVYRPPTDRGHVFLAIRSVTEARA